MFVTHGLKLDTERLEDLVSARKCIEVTHRDRETPLQRVITRTEDSTIPKLRTRHNECGDRNLWSKKATRK